MCWIASFVGNGGRAVGVWTVLRLVDPMHTEEVRYKLPPAC